MEKPFKLEIDASNYATGVVLIQRDKKGRKVHVGYHSEALDEAERNYDVYDREFLALIRAFKFWRHFLEGSSHKIKVFTNHTNLAKHREAQKLSGKITQYISFLSRFNYEFHHVPGRQNRLADALSRRTDHAPPEGTEPVAVPLPEHLFVQLIGTAALDQTIR
jgi:uncharacterized protein Usg